MSTNSPGMRAAVLMEPGRFDLAQVSVPEPGPGQVRVRLQGSGLCASNIPAFEGREWFSYPMPPGDLGHEGWGVVDAVGSDVTGIARGDRVAALSFKAYADYDVAEAEQVVKLPAMLDGQPFPGEALGCAMNIFRRADIGAGQTVAVVGVGFLGAAIIQLASAAGAKVIGVSRSESSLALARACGAAETITMDDHQRIIYAVSALTDGAFCERVVEATGKPWPLDLAGELTGVGGRLVIAGFHQDGLRSVNVQLWNWRGIDVINAHERDPRVSVRGMREAVEAVADGRLKLAPLITHRFPLERIGEALQAVVDRPDGFTKAVVLTGEVHA
ncbi:MDR/zinc-dependent alcohol dehydrogenase-like family protein [Dyella sp.]|uniref:MDR/zinc-dependent alcohol dehydrogenase-like family protein n=1 Tax=Dyella sp. TaxID=1869338 RepID=UPI002D76C00F|nr:zinc-binding dehydrogenase [Dyella sp.]HET6433082.1 zinc-binding dehydrogenase [Dyella sp.]